MSTGFEAPLHGNYEGMVEHSHYLVFITHHVNAVFFADELLINNFQRTEASIAKFTSQIDSRKSTVTYAAFDLKVTKAS